MFSVLHFVPYASAEMLGKALKLKADALVLDLEDSVTPDNKLSARVAITAWLKQADFGPRHRLVRINALDSEWGIADVESTMASRPDGYLVPKARDPNELHALDRHITQLEHDFGYSSGIVKLLPIVETPEGVLNVQAIAQCQRVIAICGGRGGLDMAAALGAWRVRDDNGDLLEVFRLTGLLCLLAASAAGIQAIDSVLLLGDMARMRRECRESAESGYTGWITIHPSQVDVVLDACFPTREEVAESRELVMAFEENRKLGKWAFRFKGQMVDVPNLKRAQTIIDRAAAREANEQIWRH